MREVYVVVDVEASDYGNVYWLVFATAEGAQAHLRREALKWWEAMGPDAPLRRQGLDAFLEHQMSFYEVQPLLD